MNMPPIRKPIRLIYWFRTDIRITDAPALTVALALKPQALYPIWCWDSHYVYHARCGPNRWQFLLDCINDVSGSLTKLNERQRLWVLREPAVTLLPRLFMQWKITHLVFEKDTDAYARERDGKVMEIAREAGVEVIVETGRTLWDSDQVVKANGGKPTMSITQLQRAGAKLGNPARPLPAPTSLPDPGDMQLDELEQERPEVEFDINKHHRIGEEQSYSAGLAGPNRDFAPPTLLELGMPAATTPHKGGETVILSRLDSIFEDEDYIATFSKPATSPAAFDPQSTLLTSPYLHFGALSCRTLYWRAEDLAETRRKEKRLVTGPPTSLTGQLLFRDMYFAAQAALGYRFAQTHMNPTARFIPWHLPSKVDTKTGLITGGYEIDDPKAEEYFVRWREGRTGFPWIDAAMRQLRLEGWIHHLARHSVACFLTRGGCYVSWERGAEVFEELLIDHETACNVGNWQWMSCVAFYAQFYRCYSPVAFGKKWDDNGGYIRKFVPELRDMDKKFIYEPWKAPIQDQRRAGVKVEGDGTEQQKDGVKLYPKPMLDFSKMREVCIQGVKNAYQIGLYGDSNKVLDGTWKQSFPDDAEGTTQGAKGGPGGIDEAGDAGDERGHEEPHAPKRGSERATEAKAVSPRATRGHKREHSQGTLDGAFKKQAKK